MITQLLTLINKILGFFSPKRKLLRLKEKERHLVEKIKQAYPNQDLINQLYHRLEWVRAQIRDIEQR